MNGRSKFVAGGTGQWVVRQCAFLGAAGLAMAVLCAQPVVAASLPAGGPAVRSAAVLRDTPQAGLVGDSALSTTGPARELSSGDTDLLLRFQPRSNRLDAAEGERLDWLADRMRSQPDSHLVLLVPSPAEAAARHFVASRLAAVDQELAKRGLTSERTRLPVAVGGESPIVLRLMTPALPVKEQEGAGPSVPDALRREGEPLVVAASSSQSPPVPESTNAGPGVPIPLGPATSASPAVPAGVPPAASSEAPAEGSLHPPPIAAEDLWIAASGRLLRDVLKEWADRAGWTVVWQSDHEYPLDAAASFSGDFTSAATQLFQGFSDVAPAPLAHFYKGNRVLVVRSGEGR